MTEAQWIDTDRDRQTAVREGWRKHPFLMVRGRLSRRRGLSTRVEIPSSKADVLRRLVDLPTSTWAYAWEDESVVHMGPMSQDFARAFGLGAHTETIDTVDACGVLVVSVQALHRRVVQLEARVAELEGASHAG